MLLPDEYLEIDVLGQTWADTLKIVVREYNWESIKTGNPYLPVKFCGNAMSMNVYEWKNRRKKKTENFFLKGLLI